MSDLARIGANTKSRRWNAVLLYASAAVLCMTCLVWVIQPREFNPRYPYGYGGDAMLHTMVIKAIIEHGWYEHIDRLSAPTGLRLEDFPLGDNFCCAIIRFLALWTSNPFLIQNLIFIGSFPVTAVITCWTFRRFGLSAPASLLGGLLYALLPYHFLRGTGHLFLAVYLLVPPACLVAWWAMQGSLLTPTREESTSEKRARRGRLYGSMGICALIGCNAVYYPFFFCAVLAVASLYAIAVRRDWRHGALAGGFIVLVGSLVVLNLLPTILYVHAHGKTVVGTRTIGEAEIYGLKVVQLLLPITHHRWLIIKKLKHHYNQFAPLVNENDLSSLGAIAASGLLVLLAWVCFARRGSTMTPVGSSGFRRLETILTPISVLNLGAILVGTIGGFSSLFALLISPQIRDYNRISVFIAFFALLAILAVLDFCVGLRLRSTAGRNTYFLGMLALLAFGVWDQTSRDWVRDYHAIRHTCIDDARFFAQIENQLPSGAMVFQLPAATFPEGGDIEDMTDYTHLRGYVQTRALRWSYGAMAGRPTDRWNQAAAALPPATLVQTLIAAGFRGLYLDGSGYTDHGAGEIAQFSRVLANAAPLLSKDGLTAFFDLSPQVALLEKVSSDRREALSHPLEIKWQKGFSGLESNDAESWRWCGPQGDLDLFNGSAAAHKTVQLTINCRAGTAGSYNLRVNGDLIHRDLKISENDTELSATIDLPPGEHIVHFDCDAPLGNSSDPRLLVWRADNAKIEDITGE